MFRPIWWNQIYKLSCIDPIVSASICLDRLDPWYLSFGHGRPRKTFRNSLTEEKCFNWVRPKIFCPENIPTKTKCFNCLRPPKKNISMKQFFFEKKNVLSNVFHWEKCLTEFDRYKFDWKIVFEWQKKFVRVKTPCCMDVFMLKKVCCFFLEPSRDRINYNQQITGLARSTKRFILLLATVY